MNHTFVPTHPNHPRTPRWAPVDDDTADLLSVMADPTPVRPSAVDDEWDLYVECLKAAWSWTDDAINPNTLREKIAGRIKPQRVGAFTHRALAQGLVEYTGEYVTSTDKRGRNGGKPAREMRWIGGAQ